MQASSRQLTAMQEQYTGYVDRSTGAGPAWVVWGGGGEKSLKVSEAQGFELSGCFW